MSRRLIGNGAAAPQEAGQSLFMRIERQLSQIARTRHKPTCYTLRSSAIHNYRNRAHCIRSTENDSICTRVGCHRATESSILLRASWKRVSREQATNSDAVRREPKSMTFLRKRPTAVVGDACRIALKSAENGPGEKKL